MKKEIFLAVFAIISDCCCLASGLKFEEKLLDVISKGDLDNLKLRNPIPEGKDEFIKFKEINLNKIRALKEGIKKETSPSSSSTSSVKEQLSKDLNLEEQELELGIKVISECENGIDTLESSVVSILNHKSKPRKYSTFTNAEVETFKKWLLASKIFKFNGIGSVNTFDFIPWIEKLKKDESLLHKLSDNVKVTVWPLTLNYSHYLSKDNNDVKEAGRLFKEEVKNVKTELDKIKNKELQEEMNLRMELIEKILLDASDLETVNVRIRIYERIMGTLVEQLLQAESVTKFNDFQKEVIKNWLMVNQMFYATEQVTASGGFVKALPKGVEFPHGYELPNFKGATGLLSPDSDDLKPEDDDDDDDDLNLKIHENLNSQVNKVEEKKKKKKNWLGFSFLGSKDKSESEKNDGNESEKKKENWSEKLLSFSIFNKKGDKTEENPEKEKKSWLGNMKISIFGNKDVVKPIVAAEVEKPQLVVDKNKPKSWLGSLFSGKSKATEEKAIDTGKAKENDTAPIESKPTTTATVVSKLPTKTVNAEDVNPAPPLSVLKPKSFLKSIFGSKNEIVKVEPSKQDKEVTVEPTKQDPKKLKTEQEDQKLKTKPKSWFW